MLKNSNSKCERLPFSRLLPLVASLLVFLTGCVHYEVGVNFQHQHRGEIVQHIQLGEQLTSLSEAEVAKWLDSLKSRGKQLKGKTQQVSPREIMVTIPFGNGQELAAKFNQFFQPNQGQTSPREEENDLDLVQLKSEMSLNQSNWLFLERDRLNLKVDLRPLGVLSNQGNIIVSPGSLIDLQFKLNLPWGGRSLINPNLLSPEILSGGNQLVWQLQPGQINEIEAIFWLPSPLGIGTLGILLLMLSGFYLKYRKFL